jgi:hypothetical protein
MMGKRMRWLLGGVGLLLPSFWLAATVLLYAWFPGFRGSGMVFGFVVFLASVLVGTAVLTAPAGWPRCLLRLALLQAFLLTEIAFILGWAYFSMGLGTRQPRIKATADWMRPLEPKWGLQSPGKGHSIQSAVLEKDAETCLRFELRKGECYAQCR